MYHVCIYNPDTLEIEGAESYSSETEARRRLKSYEIECRCNRGGSAWKPYIGDVPYAFPVAEEAPLEA